MGYGSVRRDVSGESIIRQALIRRMSQTVRPVMTVMMPHDSRVEQTILPGTRKIRMTHGKLRGV